MSRESPVEVEAELAADGHLHPVAFTWQGRRTVIRSWGRIWDDAAGRHMLVMAESGRVFELVHEPKGGTWRLVENPAMFPPRSGAA
ncbi:MAG TPA: hypothetical protein VLD63_11785 [Anaerolineales bacterium]|nr:hypothetical protein [Anaerolineales bacterium]